MVKLSDIANELVTLLEGEISETNFTNDSTIESFFLVRKDCTLFFYYWDYRKKLEISVMAPCYIDKFGNKQHVTYNELCPDKINCDLQKPIQKIVADVVKKLLPGAIKFTADANKKIQLIDDHVKQIDENKKQFLQFGYKESSYNSEVLHHNDLPDLTIHINDVEISKKGINCSFATAQKILKLLEEDNKNKKMDVDE